MGGMMDTWWGPILVFFAILGAVGPLAYRYKRAEEAKRRNQPPQKPDWRAAVLVGPVFLGVLLAVGSLWGEGPRRAVGVAGVAGVFVWEALRRRRAARP
jgi:hypothetical protein